MNVDADADMDADIINTKRPHLSVSASGEIDSVVCSPGC